MQKNTTQKTGFIKLFFFQFYLIDLFISIFLSSKSNLNTNLKLAKILVFLLFSSAIHSQCIVNTINADFEYPVVSRSGENINQNSNPSVLGWKTTAPDGMIEFWKYEGGTSRKAYSGNQFVELNANYASGLFQDYDTSIATYFIYSFAHMGRDGIDSMVLKAGPPDGIQTVIATATTDKTGWKLYTGIYKVPAGQNKTRFVFEALSSSSGNATVGNFLDAINFTATIDPPTLIGGILNTTTGSIEKTACSGSSTNLTVSGMPGAVFSWYDSTGKTLLGTGLTYTTPFLTNNTKYKIKQTNPSGCESSLLDIEVKVEKPVNIVTTGVSICKGGSGSLTASESVPVPTTTFSGHWNSATDPKAKTIYTELNNSTSCKFSASITNYTATKFTVTLSGTYVLKMTDTDAYDGAAYIYSGDFTPGNCLGGGTWIIGDDDMDGLEKEPRLIANLEAGVEYTLISTFWAFRSGSFVGDYTWTITPPSGGQFLLNTLNYWYTSLTGGDPIGWGNTFDPVGVAGSGLPDTNTSSETTYYVDNGILCSTRTPATFTIKALPTLTIHQPAAVCSSATVDLTASAITTKGNSTDELSYYSDADTNIPLSNPTTASAGTYYIKSTTTEGCSITQPVTVTGTPCLPVLNVDVKSLTKSVCNKLNEIVTYEITITNTGTAKIDGVSLLIEFPYGINSYFSTMSYTGNASGSEGGPIETPFQNQSVFNTFNIPVNGTVTILLKGKIYSPTSVVYGINDFYAQASYPDPLEPYTIVTPSLNIISNNPISGSGSISFSTGERVPGTNFNGNRSTADDVEINRLPTLTINQPAAICSTATIDLTAAAIANKGTTTDVLTYWTDEAATLPFVTPTAASAGKYYIKSTTAAGCSIVQPVTVETSPNNTVSSASSISEVCVNTALTNITHTTTGATGIGAPIGLPSGVTASLNANTLTISGTPTESGKFDYSIPLTGGCGNVIATATIKIIAKPSVDIITTPAALCIGDALTVTAPTVNDNGSIITNQGWYLDGTAFTSGTAVTYADNNKKLTYKVTNSCGTTISNEVIITVNDKPVIAATVNNILCKTKAEGSINLTVTGGIAPYTYLWSGTGVASNEKNQINLVAGTYKVTVTDSKGCNSSELSITLTEPATVLSAASSNKIDVKCKDDATGSVLITPNGGTAPYNITPAQTALPAGSYTFTVTDANNCETTVPVTISEPTKLAASISGQINVLRKGEATGSVVITPNGGTAPYNITPVQTGLPAGLHTFTVTDANNCETTVPVTITEPEMALIAIASNKVDIKCKGDATGSVLITGSGGSGGSGGYTVTPEQTGLAAGLHTFTVTDSNNISITIDVTISEPTALNAAASNLVDAKCKGDDNGSVTITPSGGTAPYDITPAQSGLTAGVHTFTVTDSNACTTTVEVTINEPDALNAAASNQVDAKCKGDDNGS
ncbi:SprB repeat-containing protein, partial [Flavobacterium sp. ov086]